MDKRDYDDLGDPFDKLTAKIIDRAVRDFVGDDYILALDAFMWLCGCEFQETYGFLFQQLSIYDYLVLYIQEAEHGNISEGLEGDEC